MNKKIRWITETGVLLALLIVLQALTKPFGQLVTGSCVNALLAIAALVGGAGCSLAVAVISPLLAFSLRIAPNFITVVPIMLGNAVYALLLWALAGRKKTPFWQRPMALILAATAKFGLLYLLVVKVICGVAADALLGQTLGNAVLLAPPMLKLLPAMFTWPQLITALLGGCVALLISPPLGKALKR